MVYNLKVIRKRRGMTQEQLSKASNIHRVSIAKYETGKSEPSLESAQKLASALGVPVDDLIGEKRAG